MVHAQFFFASIQSKSEYQIEYCFEFSAFNLAAEIGNETQFSIMEFINSAWEGMWSVKWNLDLTSLHTMKSSI